MKEQTGAPGLGPVLPLPYHSLDALPLDTVNRLATAPGSPSGGTLTLKGPPLLWLYSVPSVPWTSAPLHVASLFQVGSDRNSTENPNITFIIFFIRLTCLVGLVQADILVKPFPPELT